MTEDYLLVASERVNESGSLRIRVAGCLSVLTMLMASGCASTALIANCCYDGDEAVVYLDQVEFVASNGKTSTFAEIYPGYTAQERFATTAFPFRKANIGLVIYDSLVVPFDLYDANNNGFLEEPEITVLYLREGALGMGRSVEYLAVDGKRVGAITTSRSNVGGLMQYLNARKDTLKPETQEVFRDMVQLGQDIKLRGSEGPDRQNKQYKP